MDIIVAMIVLQNLAPQDISKIRRLFKDCPTTYCYADFEEHNKVNKIQGALPH